MRRQGVSGRDENNMETTMKARMATGKKMISGRRKCLGRKVKVKSLSRVRLFVTPWTIAYQLPLSRQEYWSGLPFPSPEELPEPGIKPGSPALQADQGGEVWLGWIYDGHRGTRIY